jgi:uncharacterized phage-associated protein
MENRVINFIKFLYSSDLVDLAVIKEDHEDGFVSRLRLQKLIYLAQECFDLNLGYEYSVYR